MEDRKDPGIEDVERRSARSGPLSEIDRLGLENEKLLLAVAGLNRSFAAQVRALQVAETREVEARDRTREAELRAENRVGEILLLENENAKLVAENANLKAEVERWFRRNKLLEERERRIEAALSFRGEESR